MNKRCWFVNLLVLILAIKHGSLLKGQILSSEDWTVNYELSTKVDVGINPRRFFHGPAAVVAPNGDWLVAFQDSFDHLGNDGVISQMRSSDMGKTWQEDAIVSFQGTVPPLYPETIPP